MSNFFVNIKNLLVKKKINSTLISKHHIDKKMSIHNDKNQLFQIFLKIYLNFSTNHRMRSILLCSLLGTNNPCLSSVLTPIRLNVFERKNGNAINANVCSPMTTEVPCSKPSLSKAKPPPAEPMYPKRKGSLYHTNFMLFYV